VDLKFKKKTDAGAGGPKTRGSTGRGAITAASPRYIPFFHYRQNGEQQFLFEAAAIRLMM